MAGSNRVIVIGGGIAGLVAAIKCARQGQNVVLHEATGKLGGRARNADGKYKANHGPHALYGDGDFYQWMRAEKLLPCLVRPRATGVRLRIDGRVKRSSPALVAAAVKLRGVAPADVDYRTWARQHASEQAVAAAIGLVSLPTFHHDPGELSAAFCQERFRRLILHSTAVRYAVGGWSEIVANLARRATDLGVEIHTSSRLTDLPDPPVLLAVQLSAASALLANSALSTPGARTVLLDVAFTAPRRAPNAVLDLTERLYISRTSGPDPTLTPDGEDLLQASAGLRPGETIDQATERIEAAMDDVFPHWRAGETWRRRSLAENASGAVDMPGSTWRDRPEVDQGDGIYLIGDAVAAPGLLSEVSYHSASQAAAHIDMAPNALAPNATR
jgi:glycine/D-amino acid oxidase-like deaminating enzyme